MTSVSVFFGVCALARARRRARHRASRRTRSAARWALLLTIVGDRRALPRARTRSSSRRSSSSSTPARSSSSSSSSSCCSARRATSPRDTADGVRARRSAAALFASCARRRDGLLARARRRRPRTLAPAAAATSARIDAIGRELFTDGLVPFELSSALLIVAVVGAVAVARGKQADPTLHAADEPRRPPSADSRTTPSRPKEARRDVDPARVLPARRRACSSPSARIGFLVRRNLLVQLMSIELMLNAVNLTLVAFNRMRPRRPHRPDVRLLRHRRRRRRGRGGPRHRPRRSSASAARCVSDEADLLEELSRSMEALFNIFPAEQLHAARRHPRAARCSARS